MVQEKEEILKFKCERFVLLILTHDFLKKYSRHNKIDRIE